MDDERAMTGRESAGEQALLGGFDVTHILPCMADPSKNRALAELSSDISAVFPYLNAIVRNAVFSPGANSFTIKRSCRILTLYPRKASLAKVDGRPDAEAQLRWVQDLCNDTWRRRDEITPCYERRKTADPIDIYQLLPQSNCRACGQATCWAFCWELLFGENSLADCPELDAPAFADARLRLVELVG